MLVVKWAGWIAVALLLLFTCQIYAPFVNQHEFFDLKIYRAAVGAWLQGADLYSFRQPDSLQTTLGFTYPPFGALVLVPFAALSEKWAIVLFEVVTLVAMLLTTFWLVKPVAARHRWHLAPTFALAVGVLFLLATLRDTYTLGQINLLLVLLILTDFLVLAPRDSRWTGALTGIAAAIKLTPGIFLIYLLVTGRYRALLTAIVAGAAATLLAAVIAPAASWEYFTSILWKGAGIGNNMAFSANQSLYAGLARIFAPETPNRLLWVALVVAAVGFGLWRARQAWRAGDDLAGVTIVGLLGCLISPLSWVHHLYWFAPAIVILVDRAASVRGLYRWLWGAFAAFVTLSTILTPIWWTTHWFFQNWYIWLLALLMLILPIRTDARALQSMRLQIASA